MLGYRDIFDAAVNGDIDGVRYFIEREGEPVYWQEASTGRTALHYAVWNGRSLSTRVNSEKAMTLIHYLFIKGANVNAKAKWGDTPLHEAVVFNTPLEVVKFLVYLGADVNARRFGGETPLHIAAIESSYDDGDNNRDEVLKYLIANGADVNAKTSGFLGLFRKTPLELAKTEEKKRILREAMEGR